MDGFYRYIVVMRNGKVLLVVGLVLATIGSYGCSSGDRSSEGAASGNSSSRVGRASPTDADQKGRGDAGTTVADPEVDEIDWSLSARSYVGTSGHVSVTCAAGGDGGEVWGTGPFTADSSICTAAVFAGQIAPHYGGEVTFELSDGLQEYAGGESNGVTTQPHGRSDSSFDFVDQTVD